MGKCDAADRAFGQAFQHYVLAFLGDADLGIPVLVGADDLVLSGQAEVGENDVPVSGKNVFVGPGGKIVPLEGHELPGDVGRIIEIPALTGDLREKMFKDRLSDWKVSKNVWDILVDNTEDWTGAEVQELVNSLNLKHISSNRKAKKIDTKWANEIVATMKKFGVGEASSEFGFHGKKPEKD